MKTALGAFRLLAALALLAVAACTSAPAAPDGSRDEQPQVKRARVQLPDAATVVLPGGSAEQLALETSQALFTSSPLVVWASAGDAAAHTSAAVAAQSLGAPLLLSPPEELRSELQRLTTERVLAFGGAEVLSESLGDAVEVLAAHDVDRAVEKVAHGHARPEPVDDLLVLAPTAPEAVAAVATARAAGARVVTLAGTDPRAQRDAIAALAGEPTDHIVALGSGFGDPETVRVRVETAASGEELPGGGQVLLPGRRLVALYGHPGSKTLGALGEQGPAESVRRIQQLAVHYEPHSDVPVLPTFEIIATVASGGAGKDGDYSAEAKIEHLRPYVDAAADAGIYVVLDLQPGRTDFLTQARRYEELLALPHVGLALDPEWRLGPKQRHLRQIGTVDSAEINEVAEWLAGFVRERRLPQKLLVLHQFKPSMISNRGSLDATWDELAVVIQMDGHGSRGDKLASWQRILREPPEGVQFGWKNFFRRDTPMFSPAETLTVDPSPVFVSYQ